MVTGPRPYHLSEQGARQLLDPVRAELEALEARLQHYRDHIRLDASEDAPALETAQEALTRAREGVAALGRETEEAGESGSPARRRVLITGAGGRIGVDLAGRLRDRYDLRLMYHHQRPDPLPEGDWVQADITNVGELTKAMAGVDAVVHLAADANTRAGWESMLQNNIAGTFNVFEAARQAGARRIVFASTNHVMGMYDRDRQWPIYTDEPARPDSLYGLSKAFGEDLGRFWYDQHGINVICLRIGWWLPEPKDEIARWMWLSPRDCAQLVTRALETDLGFGIFYAISANSRRHWDITNTTECLGYRPEDDAERYFGNGSPESEGG